MVLEQISGAFAGWISCDLKPRKCASDTIVIHFQICQPSDPFGILDFILLFHPVYRLNNEPRQGCPLEILMDLFVQFPTHCFAAFLENGVQFLVRHIDRGMSVDLFVKLFIARCGCGECSIDGADDPREALNELIRHSGGENDKFCEGDR
jgi:hypothetical protein